MDEKEIIRKYISVENIYLPVLSNKEFLNFLSRFHALLPLEPVDQSPDANPPRSASRTGTSDRCGSYSTPRIVASEAIRL